MSQIRWHIGVLVPARNEESLLPRCLASLLVASAMLPEASTCDIVVVVDSSTDRTLEVAETLLAGHGVVIPIDARAVGRARSVAAQVLLERYNGPLKRCWLANTDADCEVPPDWLTRQLAIARQGVDAVAGIVDVDTFLEHDTVVQERFRLSYHVYADGTHPHVHGANMGIRADAYLRAGGWLDLETAEDHDLWHRLHQTGHYRLSAATLMVTTSGRKVGRAPNGFAGALAAHNEAHL